MASSCPSRNFSFAKTDCSKTVSAHASSSGSPFPAIPEGCCPAKRSDFSGTGTPVDRITIWGPPVSGGRSATGVVKHSRRTVKSGSWLRSLVPLRRYPRSPDLTNLCVLLATLKRIVSGARPVSPPAMTSAAARRSRYGPIPCSESCVGSMISMCQELPEVNPAVTPSSKAITSRCVCMGPQTNGSMVLPGRRTGAGSSTDKTSSAPSFRSLTRARMVGA